MSSIDSHVSFNDPNNASSNNQPNNQTSAPISSPDLAKTKKQAEILKDYPTKSQSHVRKRSWSASAESPASTQNNSAVPSISHQTQTSSSNELNANSDSSSSSTYTASSLPADNTSSHNLSSSVSRRIYAKRTHMKSRNPIEYHPHLERKNSAEKESLAKSISSSTSESSPQQPSSSPTPSKKGDVPSLKLSGSNDSPKLKEKEKSTILHLNLLKTFKSKGSSPRLSPKSPTETTRERRMHMQRMHSFHAGMKKIAPHSDEPLSLLHPPLSARRNYLPSSFSGKKIQDNFDINALKLYSDKNTASEFDELVKKNIRFTWETHTKPEISSLIIEENIDKTCREEISQLFNKKDRINYELFLTESPRTKHLLRFIKFGGIPLKQVIERLEILQNGIKKYMDLTGSKTAWSELLYKYLDKLLTPDQYSAAYYGLTVGRDIFNFLTIIDEILENKECSKIKKIILLGFGDTEKKQKSVLATLRKWSNPDLDLKEELQKNVHEISQEAQYTACIPFFRHYWEENSTHPPLSKVTIGEILRCFKLHEYVNFKKITVNKKTIFEEVEQGSPKILDNDEFYFKLLKAINHSGFDKKATDDVIKDQVKFLLEERKTTPEEDIVRKSLPCVNLLRLATNSSWLRCHDCIRFLFPKLFTSPYYAKAVEGTECHINVKSSTVFNVELIRNYGVFYLENPSDPTSTTPDLNKKLATVPFSWTIFPEGESSQSGSSSSPLSDVVKILGKLTTQDPIIEEHISKEVKSYILYSIIDFTDAELILDTPETPRIESQLELPKPALKKSHTKKA